MNRVLVAGMLSCVAFSAGCTSTGMEAPSGNCPVCRKPVADGPEVRVLIPGTREPGTRYRCFVCPLVEGTSGATWTMRAVSGMDGTWVTFRVERDRVVSDPPTAVVLALRVGPGDECLDVHR